MLLTLTFTIRGIGIIKQTIGNCTMNEQINWNTTIRVLAVLAVLAFAVWIIQSPYSGWWILLAAMIAGL
jgi:hypothetical protein